MTIPPSLRRHLAPGLLLLTAVILTVVINASLTVRFAAPGINYAAATLITLSLPVSLCWLTWNLRSWPWRIGVGIPVLLLSMPLLLLAYFQADAFRAVLHRGVDLSLEPVQELQSGARYYRIYRNNGNATSSWNIVLREEYTIIPGLRLVHDLADYDDAHDAALAKTAEGKVSLTVASIKPGIANKVLILTP